MSGNSEAQNGWLRASPRAIAGTRPRIAGNKATRPTVLTKSADHRRMDREQARRAIARRDRNAGALLRAAAAALLAATTLAAPVAAAPEPAPRFFRIAAASTTGTYFVIGAEIANAISKPPGARDCAHGGSCGVAGLVAVAQATQGSIENALLVGSGQVEAAFIAADVARWAYSGRSPQLRSCRGAPESGTALLAKSGAISNLRAIAALFPEGVHLVARADAKIKTLADLKGKRVAMGEPGSGTLAEARRARCVLRHRRRAGTGDQRRRLDDSGAACAGDRHRADEARAPIRLQYDHHPRRDLPGNRWRHPDHRHDGVVRGLGGRAGRAGLRDHQGAMAGRDAPHPRQWPSRRPAYPLRERPQRDHHPAPSGRPALLQRGRPQSAELSGLPEAFSNLLIIRYYFLTSRHSRAIVRLGRIAHIALQQLSRPSSAPIFGS